MGKTIIVIEPRDSEKTSLTVNNSTDKVVQWNTYSIVSEIREY